MSLSLTPQRWIISFFLVATAATHLARATPLIREGSVSPARELVAWLTGDPPAERPRLEEEVGFVGRLEAVDGLVGRAFGFDGTGVIQLTNALPVANEFTVEMWVYPELLDGRVDVIASGEGSGGGGPRGWELGLRGPLDPQLALPPPGQLCLRITGVPGGFEGWLDAGVKLPAKTWSHVALIQSLGRISVLVNGRPVRIDRDPVGNLSPFVCRLGAPRQDDRQVLDRFNGRIDEFSVYRRALLADEVGRIVAAGAAGKSALDQTFEFGAQRYWIEPGGKVTAELRLKFSDRFGAPGLSDFSVTNEIPAGLEVVGVENSLGQVSVNPGQVVWRAQDLGGYSSIGGELRLEFRAAGDAVTGAPLRSTMRATIRGNPEILVASSSISVSSGCASGSGELLAWWRGKGFGNSVDATVGMPLGGLGQVGLTVGFNRLSWLFAGQGGLQVPRSPGFGAGDFTAEGWLMRGATPVSNDDPFMEAAIIGGEPGRMNLGFDEFGHLIFSPGTGTTVTSTGVILDRAWHHVAIAKSGSQIGLFIDGRESGAGQIAETAVALGEQMVFGANVGAAGEVRDAFQGVLDEFALFRRALPAAEVKEIFNAGTAGHCPEDVRVEATFVSAENPDQVVATAKLGAEFMVVTTIENLSRTVLSDVVFTNIIPPQLELVRASSAIGLVSNLGDRIVIKVARLLPGPTSPSYLTFKAKEAGSFQIDCLVGRSASPDLAGNNRATLLVEVPPPALLTTSTVATEGPGAVATIGLQLDAPLARDLRLGYTTVSGSAVAGADFVETKGELLLAAGTLSATVAVPILDDALVEGDETFSFVVTKVVDGLPDSGVSITPGQLTVLIRDDEPIPSLTVTGGSVREAAGFTNAVFAVRASPAGTAPLSFAYTTVGGTASAGGDFTAVQGTAQIMVGQTEFILTVPILPDDLWEGDERFSLVISNPTNATLASASAVMVIEDDDRPDKPAGTLVWELPGGDLVSTVPFPAGLRAVADDGSLLSHYTGRAQVVASAAPGGLPPRVLISEVDFESRIELANVSEAAQSLAGWRLVVYDQANWPQPAGIFQFGALSLDPHGIVVVTRNAADGSFALGLDAGPRTSLKLAVALLNSALALEDFVLFGSLDPRLITQPFAVPVEAWSGSIPGMAIPTLSSVHRRGQSNHRNASDWAVSLRSIGQRNEDMAEVFDDARLIPVQPSEVVLTNGVWLGTMTLGGFSPEVALFASTADGLSGASPRKGMAVADDLTLQLRVSPQPATHLEPVLCSVSVTNSGFGPATQVVVEVPLDAYFGAPAVAGVADLQSSRGSVEVVGTNYPSGVQGTLVIARIGNLDPGAAATVSFSAQRSWLAPLASAPLRLSMSASVHRAEPELDLRNNYAVVVTPLEDTCASVPPGLAGWWRADGDRRDSVSPAELVAVGSGPGYAAGRAGSQAFSFDGQSGLATSNAPAWDFGPGQSFSIEGWLRIPVGTSRGTMSLLDRRGAANEAGFPAGYSLRFENGALVFWFVPVGEGGSGIQIVGTSPTLTDGAWHHFGLSVNRSAMGSGFLALDGQVNGYFGFEGNAGSLVGGAPLRIAHASAGSFDDAWIGELDELSVYGRTLAEEDFTRLFRAGRSGKCLRELEVGLEAEAGGTLPLFFGQTRVLHLRVTNRGPLRYSAPALAVLPTAGPEAEFTAPTLKTLPELALMSLGIPDLAAGEAFSIPLSVRVTNAVSGEGSLAFSLLPVPNEARTSRKGFACEFPFDRDFDDDGLDDDWELGAGYNPANAADSLVDEDGDGWSAADEFAFATNPAAPADRPDLQLNSGPDGIVTLRFPGKSGRIYQLMKSRSPDGPWSAASFPVSGTGSELEFVDPVPAAAGGFYLILVSR